MTAEMNANSEIRAISHDEIDAVAGGAIYFEIKLPGATVTTLVTSDVSGVVIQYSGGDIEGKRA